MTLRRGPYQNQGQEYALRGPHTNDRAVPENTRQEIHVRVRQKNRLPAARLIRKYYVKIR